MNIIMAVDEQWNIGIDNKLLTHLPSDLQRFKNITQGQVVVMGRATFDSLPVKPLPNRRNAIITSRPDSLPSDVSAYTSVEDFLVDKREFLENNFMTGYMPIVYVIGGGNLIKQLLPYCDRAFITKIHDTFTEANKSMPNLDNEGWRLILESAPMEEEGYTYSYCLYEK